jgi:hypothetical protein
MTLRRQTWCLLGLLVFAASFAVRITAIKMFPQYDHHDDIEIYRASGALIVRGINPYDFSDHIPVRTSLREQSPNPYMRELSQARWDYYASSNLPMNFKESVGVAVRQGSVRDGVQVPFGRGVAAMVGTRLALASTLQPQHASIWVIPSIYLPSGWKALRLALLLSALGVSFVGYWRKRIGIDVLCATVLLAFVVIWMINGGTDRQNIALLPAILLLGRRSPRAAFICLMPYLLAGLGGFVTHGLHGQPVNFAVRETLEGLGILLFVIVYLVIAGWTWLFSRNLNPAPAAEFASSTA